MMHWSERVACSCGKTFKIGSRTEMVHRHNFPALCKSRKTIMIKHRKELIKQ